MELNGSFQNRMSELLGDGFKAYMDSFDEESVKAFHLNLSVISADAFSEWESCLDDIDYSKIPDSPYGF